ncbi:BldC family transcriptional regulator [Cellulosimicrobium composti]|uniref:BldC family transcriptional regulator n=1 Tax=Cellulosimicrobium composti TaxID=2672572 RepID=UPI00378C8AB8
MTGQHEPMLLTPAEVARMFRVDPATVARWARTGQLSTVRTLGGRRRFYATEIEALMDRRTQTRSEEPDRPDKGP